MLATLAWLMACSGPAEEAPMPAHAETAGWVDANEGMIRDAVAGERPAPRVVNLWATWCQPCLRELPELVAFARARPDVDLVLVSLDHPSVRARGSAVLEERGVDGFPVLHLGEVDPTGTVKRAIPEWSETLPWTAVVDKDGRRLATFPYAITRADLESTFSQAAPTQE